MGRAARAAGKSPLDSGTLFPVASKREAWLPQGAPEGGDAELDISVDSELMPLLPPGFLESQVAALAGGPSARAPQLAGASDAGAACGGAAGLSRWLCEHRVHMLWALAAEGAMLAAVLAAYVALSRARRADLELVRAPGAPMPPRCGALSTCYHLSCVARAVAEPFQVWH